MKILLDTCVWGGAVDELIAVDHDVVWAGHWTEDPGDEQILARAHAEERVCVEVTWWDSMRDRGWPREIDSIYGPGGVHKEQAEWPVIAMFGESSGFEQGIFPGRAPVANLQGEVQRAILEEMWSGGGISMICKDDDDRFVREDGSPILLWQFEDDDDGTEGGATQGT